MNDIDNIPDLPETLSAPLRPPRLARFGVWLTGPRLLGVIAIVLTLVVWLITYRQMTNLNDELARRLTAFDTRGSESRLLAGKRKNRRVNYK